jgi:hypothetical protein
LSKRPIGVPGAGLAGPEFTDGWIGASSVTVLSSEEIAAA